MASATGWRNRIVGHGEEAPDQLLANPANWRIHPKNQQDALSGVLDELGWIQSVIVSQRSGHVVDGHLRVALAISRNEPSIPVVYVDLDENEEKLALSVVDPISALAATDREQLSALLDEVSTGDAAVQAMLDQLAQDGQYGEVPSLDDLAAEHGDPSERDFWPVVRVQVSPETHERYQSLMGQAPGTDEGERFARLLEAVDAAVLGDE